jgi:hypothetical protein
MAHGRFLFRQGMNLKRYAALNKLATHCMHGAKKDAVYKVEGHDCLLISRLLAFLQHVATF